MATSDTATAAEEEKGGFEKLTDFLGDVFEILTGSDVIDFESLNRRTAESTRRLQEQLQERGFYDGAIDGDFGPASAQAMLAYLRENPSQVHDVHYSFLRVMETTLDPESRRAFEQEFGADLAVPAEDLLAQNNVNRGSLIDPGLIAHMREHPAARMIVAKTLAAAEEYGIDGGLLANQFWQESKMGLLGQSGAGAMGIAQFIAETGDDYGLLTTDDFFDMDKSINAGAAHMRDLTDKFGHPYLALVAYNGGAGAIDHVAGRFGTAFVTYEEWMNTMRLDRLLKGIHGPDGAVQGNLWRVQTYEYVQHIAPAYWDEEKRAAALAANTVPGKDDRWWIETVTDSLFGSGDDYYDPQPVAAAEWPALPPGVATAQRNRSFEIASEDAAKALIARLAEGGFIASDNPDGAIGDEHAAALGRYLRDKLDDIDPAALSFIAIDGALKDGKLGIKTVMDAGIAGEDAVKRLQTALAAQGYYKGMIDGQPGNGTLDAVTAYLSDMVRDILPAPAVAPAPETVPETQPQERRELSPQDGHEPLLSSVSIPHSYGLPAAFSAGSLQRLLQMAGYDVGAIDGDIGAKTCAGVRAMLARHPEIFSVLYDGKPEDLSDEEIKAMAQPVYQAALLAGVDDIRREPQRYQMFVRATEAASIAIGGQDRTVVQGEIIIRAPDGRELFMLKDGEGYSAVMLRPEEARDMADGGQDVMRPAFNSGGLNMAGRRLAMQDAYRVWNPYDGNALPGLAGGTVYGINFNPDLINITAGLRKSFGDSAGRRSWIGMEVLDPEAVTTATGIRRDAFGMHVDGNTVLHDNDGTAGCIGVRSEYAAAFFDYFAKLPAEARPDRIVTLAPADTGTDKAPASLPAYEKRAGDTEYNNFTFSSLAVP